MKRKLPDKPNKPESPKRKYSNVRKSPTAGEKARKLFQKGGPGGPGRPKGSVNKFPLKKFLEDALQLASIKVTMPDGKEHIVSGKMLVAMEMVDLALNGPVSQGIRQRALGELADRTDGKAAQTIRNFGDGAGKVNILIKRNLGEKDDETVEVREERVEPAPEEKK